VESHQKGKGLSAEVVDLKQNLTDVTAIKQAKNEQLQTALHKVGDDLHRTQDFVLHQHELSFNKALDEAAYFYNVPLNEGKFDVNKDFYKGELVLVDDIRDEEGGEEFTQLATPGLDNAGGKV